MSSALTSTASLKRNEFLVVVKANPPTYDGTGAASTTSVTAAVGTLFRVYGKKVITPAQGSAAASANQVQLLKVGLRTNVANSAVGEGDCVNTVPVFINLLDGYLARV